MKKFSLWKVSYLNNIGIDVDEIEQIIKFDSLQQLCNILEF